MLDLAQFATQPIGNGLVGQALSHEREHVPLACGEGGDSGFDPALTVVPLVKETTGPRLAYRIAMGVRYADQEWKRQLNRTIQDNQPAINRLLLSFGVPLLDDHDRAITEDSIPK